jgi:hypothetical protein
MLVLAFMIRYVIGFVMQKAYRLMNSSSVKGLHRTLGGTWVVILNKAVVIAARLQICH